VSHQRYPIPVSSTAGSWWLIGPSATGFAFDLTHDCTLPILAGVAANIVAALIVITTRTPADARNRTLS
jgi:hypothetical protein